MAKICSRFTTAATQTVINPVSTWVSNQTKKCKGKWWKPSTWLCWFETIFVLVVVLVTTYIIVYTTTIICVLTAVTIGLVLLPIAWVIDLFCNFCRARYWVDVWLFTCKKVELINKQESVNNP